MALTRWRAFHDPWNDLNRLQEQMSRLFSRLGANDRAAAPVYPSLNLWQDGDYIYVESELPGLKLGDLEIVVTGGNQLSIKGRREPALPDGAVWHRQERGYGEFSRLVRLPIDVDADNVAATLKNGVLTIKLPKYAEAKPRKIAVTGG
jgi:HSP20 family protein